MIKQEIIPVMILGQEVNCVELRLNHYDLGGDTCQLTFQVGYTEEFQGPFGENIVVGFTPVASGTWTPSQEVFDSWGVDDIVLVNGFMADYNFEAREV